MVQIMLLRFGLAISFEKTQSRRSQRNTPGLKRLREIVSLGFACLIVMLAAIIGASPAVAQAPNPILLHPDDNAAVSDEILSRRWPNGVVYYDILIPKGSTRTEADFDSIRRWEALTSGAVRFIKSSTKEPRILITLDEANGTNGLRGIREADGRLISGVRGISIRADVSYSVHHELGHVLGRWHQQRHPDSGQCLTLNANAGARVSPEKVIGRYTSNSIMHYHRPGNSQPDYDSYNPDPILCPRPQLTELPSDFDIKYFQKMYGVNGDYFNNTSWCSGNAKRLHMGDFNGDGLDDLLCHAKDGAPIPGRLRIDYANDAVNNVFGDGDWIGTSSSFCRLAQRQLHIGDFNGDGRDDLLCFDTQTGRRFIDFANTVGEFNGTNAVLAPFCTVIVTTKRWVGEIYVADYDGDGSDDMLCHLKRTGALWIDYANNGLDGADWSSNAGWCRDVNRSIVVGNFNSDGRADMICHDANDGHRWINYANPNGGFDGAAWNSKSGFKFGDGAFCKGRNRTVYAADMSGNGLDDLVCHNSWTGSVAIDYALTVGEARNFNDAPATTELRGSDLWFANYFNEISFCNSQDANLLIGRLPTSLATVKNSLYCQNSATGHQVGRYSLDD